MGWIAMTAAAAMLAASAPGSAAARKSSDAADPGREICKSRPVVGSRLKRIRECHTAAQWEEMKLAEQIGLGRQQFHGYSGQSSEELNGQAGAEQPSPGRFGRDTPW